MFVNGTWWNSFQIWARRYGERFGFVAIARGNWVILIGHAREIECMSVDGVKAACGEVEA